MYCFKVSVIGRITDTLKILIENTKPNKDVKTSDALKEIAHNTKMGKNNSAIVRALLKVVLDDVYYEIACAQDYVDYLLENIKGFNTILKYQDKMKNAKNEKKKNYYLEYIKLYLEPQETIDNFQEIFENYKIAYSERKTKIDTLYEEAKIIKKLKV